MSGSTESNSEQGQALFGLTGAQRRRLKGLAQRMEPTVRLGKQGLSASFLESVRQALELHELIKVRFESFKEEKKVLMRELAHQTQSEFITQVGHVVVLYRRNPDEGKRKIQI